MSEIPEKLRNSEYRFILLRMGEKIPLEKDWQNTNNYPWDDEKLTKHIEEGGNYGIIGGYGNLILLDFDTKEAYESVAEYLPKTFQTASGGKGLPHLYYHTPEPANSFKVLDQHKNTLMDVQGIGKQVVGPGSRLRGGGVYTITEDLPIKTLGVAELKALITAKMPGAELAGLPKEETEKRLTYQTDDDLPARIKAALSFNSILGECGIDTSKNPGSCPWHASAGGKCFSFDNSQGVWHCFHCLKGGDLFTLWMESKGVDFKTALEELRQKAGIEKPAVQAKVRNVMQQASPYTDLAVELIETIPVYFDKAKIWWKWNEDNFTFEISDEVDVLNLIKYGLEYNPDMTITKRALILEAIRQEARYRKPIDLGEEWVQFGDKHYNIETGEQRPATHEYFSVNPIPWTPSEDDQTPTLDRLFEEWVGPDYIDTLYELIAYCCYRSYPINLLFALVGHGRNGKSQFLRILEFFLTKQNVATSSLKKLAGNRFEAFGLYRKLACIMGETSFSVLEDTDLLKQLTGGDLIDYEKKMADKFSDYNYAKIIMATNSLPSSEDTSEGYYRRWLIIDFPNQFPEGNPIWKTVPDEEYHALARKVLNSLPRLLERHEFKNQGTIKQREARYIEKSNPLSMFIEECCNQHHNNFVFYSRLYTAYLNWLREKKMRKVSYKEFTSALQDLGVDVVKTSKMVGGEVINGRWIMGLELDDQKLEISTGKLKEISKNVADRERVVIENGKEKGSVPVMSNVNDFQLVSLRVENESKTSAQSEQQAHNPSTPEIRNLPKKEPVPQETKVDYINENDRDKLLNMISVAFENTECDVHQLAMNYPQHPIDEWVRVWKERGQVVEVRPGVIIPL